MTSCANPHRLRPHNFVATERMVNNHDESRFSDFVAMKKRRCLIDEGCLHHLMYAIYPGAKEGLRNFKKRPGFRPYRVRYSMS
jgi:hypothetical protein